MDPGSADLIGRPKRWRRYIVDSLIEIYPVTSSAVTNARIASHPWDFGCNRFDAN